MKKIIVLLAAVAALASCASAPEVKVDAWICPHSGNLKGIIVDYGTAIDSASVSTATYTVEGQEITGVTVMDNRVVIGLAHPACGQHAEAAAESCCNDEGVQEKEAESCCNDETVIPELPVTQVLPVKTADGRTIKAWKAPVKAE